MGALYINYINNNNIKTKIDANLNLSGVYITSSEETIIPENNYFGYDWNTGGNTTLEKKSDFVKCVVIRSF